MQQKKYFCKRLQIINPKHHKFIVSVQAFFGIIAILLVIIAFLSNALDSVREIMDMKIPITRPVFYLILGIVTVILIVTYLLQRKSLSKQLTNLTISNSSLILTDGAETKNFSREMIKEIVPYCLERRRKTEKIFDTHTGIKIYLHSADEIYDLTVDINDTSNIQRLIKELKEKRFPILKDFGQIKSTIDSIKKAKKHTSLVAAIGGIFLLILIAGLVALAVYYSRYYK